MARVDVKVLCRSSQVWVSCPLRNPTQHALVAQTDVARLDNVEGFGPLQQRERRVVQARQQVRHHRLHRVLVPWPPHQPSHGWQQRSLP